MMYEEGRNGSVVARRSPVRGRRRRDPGPGLLRRFEDSLLATTEGRKRIDRILYFSLSILRTSTFRISRSYAILQIIES